METTINQRIKIIIEESGMTITAFARKIGIAQTSLRECVINNTEPKYSTLYKIIKAVPTLSSLWLLTGEGSMNNGGSIGVEEKNNDEPIEATLQINLKGSRNNNGFSLTFSGGTLKIEGE